MPWIEIQHASQASWDDNEEVAAKVGNGKPDGLIVWAAGEADGRGRQSASGSPGRHERLVEERVVHAVREVLGEEMAAAGPPPTEWLEVKHMMDL